MKKPHLHSFTSSTLLKLNHTKTHHKSTNSQFTMGCCYSTTNKPPHSKPPQIPTAAKQSTSFSKSPPPTSPLADEETVKEVLSETPSSIPKPPILRSHRKAESPFIKAAPLLNGAVYRKPFTAFDDASDASEICSTHSDSVSAATSVTEKRDARPEMRQMSPSRFKNRSFSGEMNRERTVDRSPGRRPDPSQNRVRSGYVKRRENGESSGRRSRSPATRADSGAGKPGLERTQSGRKTGKSPGRVGSGLGERIREVDGGKERGDSKWLPPTSNNELLENPLVSLECFIFL